MDGGRWLGLTGKAVLVCAQAATVFAFVRCWKSAQLTRFFVVFAFAVILFVACGTLGYMLDPDRRAGVNGGGTVGVVFGAAAGIGLSGVLMLALALTVTKDASP